MTEGEGPFLTDTGNGLSIRYRGRNLYSPSSPIDAARKRAGAFACAPETLVFVPSPLLFYGIDVILEQLGSDVHFLCVETDQALMSLSLEHTPQSLLHDSRISYVRTDSVDEVLRALHRAGVARFRRAAELLVNGGSSVNRSLYTRMFHAVEHEIQNYWRNRMTFMHMSHLWIKNFFQNISELASGGDFGQLHTLLPVVVAGAGESIEGAAPLLRSLRDRYFLLAVDTAAGSASDLGLRPDAVVVLDAQSANLADLVGFDTEGVQLLADVTAYPDCIRRFTGERWFFFSEFAPAGLFRRVRAAGLLPTPVPPLGSVGITALYCALTITEGPVLFAGLDFAFRPGKSHARGAPAHIAGLAESGRLSPLGAVGSVFARGHRIVEGKGGMGLWTDNSLAGYNSSLDLLVRDRGRVYDIGRTGLRNSAPLLEDERSVARVLTEARSERTTMKPGPESAGIAASSRRRTRAAAAQRLLREERSRIDRGVRAVTKALQSGNVGEAAPERVKEAVRELDYVYLHFPDWSESPVLNESFLKRFVEASETRARWIDRGLARFG